MVGCVSLHVILTGCCVNAIVVHQLHLVLNVKFGKQDLDDDYLANERDAMV